MKKLLERKSFIYLSLSVLILWMFVAFGALPLSLFPSTEKPAVKAWLRYTRLSSVDFKAQYGDEIESKLSQIDNVGRSYRRLLHQRCPIYCIVRMGNRFGGCKGRGSACT